MATLNKSAKNNPIYTHEGAKAQHINPYQQLRRSVCSCMLWEREFYEDGESVASRIQSLIPEVDPVKVSDLAIEARTKFKLRHIPLLLARELARVRHKGTANVLSQIIQRPDELTEFLSIYWKDGKCPLSAQVKKGLATAFPKFSEYQLAKYNRNNEIRLRDVLFLSHAKPKNVEQAEIWGKLINGELNPPDTWEVALSAGKDKKATWERLLSENKLGGLAFLRNLRNMRDVWVDDKIIFSALSSMKVDKILPYRFIAAAKHAPQWEDKIEPVMLKCIKDKERLSGKTVLLVDVSGSMDWALSAKSDLNRIDAANGLAILVREICDDVEIFSFSNKIVQIPPRRGFALRDVIYSSQPHSRTYLGTAVGMINEKVKYDRIIVITDEQSRDLVPNPTATGYMINVASARNGVGYGAWKHIDGFSEAVIDWITEYEKIENY
jgi:60 kDa SS-A/Ro ribonucleoprotein